MERRWNKHIDVARNSTSEKRLFEIGIYYLEKYKEIGEILPWMKCYLVYDGLGQYLGIWDKDHFKYTNTRKISLFKIHIPYALNLDKKFPDWIPIVGTEFDTKMYVIKIGDHPYSEASIIFKCLFEN